MLRKQFLLILLALLTWNVSESQTRDTIINRGIYKSYFSYTLQQPVFVSYKLYKGGGECDRSKFRFINDTKLEMIDNLEYTGLGYDRGHIANAEDFAYDCKKDELTFRYYNCLPQTPNLNRGPWKSWEAQIRADSQKDSLLIISGGIWDGRIIKGVNIPVYCWKVVQSLSTKKVVYCLFFTNETSNSKYVTMTVAALEKKLKYKLPLKK